MDDDLETMTREQLIAEAVRLRQGIRQHRDSTGQELCWHHPALWSLLPEKTDPLPVVPEWPQFLRGCIRYPSRSTSRLRRPRAATSRTAKRPDRSSGKERPWDAAPETEPFLDFADVQYLFVQDPSGKVTHVIVRQGGSDMEARKIR